MVQFFALEMKEINLTDSFLEFSDSPLLAEKTLDDDAKFSGNVEHKP